MKNVSAFVVLGALIISVVLTGCADLDNALSSLKVDQQKDSLTEDIDRAKNESIAAFSASELMTVKKLSYLTDSASRTLRSSEQGEPTQLQPQHRQCQFTWLPGAEISKPSNSTWLLAQMWMRRISGGPLLCLRRPVKDTRQFQNFSSTMGQI